jgi:glycosyltransferase involved in cell wall biosynthesis
MGRGGAETFLMKVYRNIDRSKIQFDFLVSMRRGTDYEDEIEHLGGNIYLGYRRRNHPLKMYRLIKELVNKKHYKIVYSSSNMAVSFIDLIFAKRGGALLRVMRSSSSSVDSALMRFLHKIFRATLSDIANLCIAPSTEAGVWMFGKKIIKQEKLTIIKNGLHLDEYHFNEQCRIKIRNELAIGDKFLLGHVGRFAYVKNHEYIVKVFSEIHCLLPDSALILVGDGEKLASLRKQASDAGLAENVHFVGERDNVPEYLMAMDLLIFPSFREGMPNVVIEAQATGLHCLVSDRVTREVAVTDLVEFLDIDAPPKVWADRALSFTKSFEREDKIDELRAKGYDIADSAKFLENCYLKVGAEVADE